jgi:hypothetical protein
MPAAVDSFAPANPALTGPYTNAVAVTPSDSADLTTVTRALYVGAAGDVTLVDQASNTTLFKAVPTGTVLPVRATRVKATGTTATQIVALW